MKKAINEPDVAYCCCIVAGNYIYEQDTKIYKRKGNAIKRCKRLNQQEEKYKYRVLAASGWHDVEVQD